MRRLTLRALIRQRGGLPMVRLAVVAMLLWMLAACVPTGTEPVTTRQPLPTPTASPMPAASVGQQLLSRLAGTKWELVSYGPAENPTMARPNARVTATFMGEAGIVLNLGCNGTYADLVAAEDGVHLDFSRGELTELFCEGEGIMEQEELLWAVVRTSEIARLTNDQLVISYPGGELRYRKQFPLEVKLFRLSGIEIGGIVQTPVSNTVVVAAFADEGLVSGFAGCNDYSGRHSMVQGSVTFQEISAGNQSCLEPAINEQERIYLDGLRTADRYTWRGGILTLFFPGGSLRFTRMPFLESGLKDHASWRLVSFGLGPAAQPPMPDTELTITFTRSTTGEPLVYGSAGCNDYSGYYQIRGTTTELLDLAATEIRCAEGVMAQEQRFLAALQATRHVALDGRLLLVHDEGILVFEGDS